MAETAVTRNLSQIDASLKQVNASIKSCTADSKSLDKALKLDPANINLASTRTAVLKDQIELTRQKLESLKAKQAEFDRQTASGMPVNTNEYRKLQVQISQTESQLSVLTKQTTALNTVSLNSVKNQFSGLSTAAKTTLGIIAAIGIAFATESDSIADASEAIGVSYESYQVWSNLFEKVTGDSSGFSTSMQSVTTVLAGISKGSTKSQEALANLGLSIDDLKGKSNTEAFQIILEALSKVTDESQRMILAEALLGDGGTELAKVAGLTSSQISSLNSEFEKTGMLTNEQVTNGKNWSDTLKDLKKEGMVVVAQLGTALLPTFESVAKILENLAPITEKASAAIAALGPAGQVAVVGGLAFLAMLPSLITGIYTLKTSLDALSSNPVMLAVAAAVAGAAIGIGAAILTDGVTSASSSYSTSTTTDNSSIVINVTSDSDDSEEIADKVAEAVVTAKRQRGQL